MSKGQDYFPQGCIHGVLGFLQGFLGYDAGFFEPIHPLPGLDVDVAAKTNNEEEGLFNDHLVENFPDMDMYVLEVGHRFV